MSTAMALSDSDRTRLIRLLGMMGSDHDGEALNAARLADRLIRERRATWSEVVATGDPPVRPQPPRTWRETLAACRAQPDRLSPWEAEFLASLSDWLGTPTQR